LGVDRSRVAVHNWVQKPIYSQLTARARIALLSIKKRSGSMTSSTGCTLLSIQKRTIYSTHSLSQRQIMLSQIGFSLISVTNTMSMTQLFSLMDQPHFSEPVANTTSILDTNDMEIGTALNVSFMI
jgi:hypothetical protein